MSPYVAAADEAILSVVESMVGMGLPSHARAQVGLPFAEGGCGVRLPSNVQGPARVAGIASYIRNGRTQVGVPSMAHHVAPADSLRILAGMCMFVGLGNQFEPLATWSRGWWQSPHALGA